MSLRVVGSFQATWPVGVSAEYLNKVGMGKQRIDVVEFFDLLWRMSNSEETVQEQVKEQTTLGYKLLKI